MKKFLITFFACFILCCIIGFIEINVLEFVEHKNKNNSEKLLEIANSAVQDNNSSEDSNSSICESTSINNEQGIIIKVSDIAKLTNVTESSDTSSQNIIGTLKISSINVEAPIVEGTSQQNMKNAIGHFTQSDYWNGNVSLASHNGGISAHYFARLNEVKLNDEIVYNTKLGCKKYKVESINKIKENDWTMILKNNSGTTNTITLVTCISGQPKYRLCVRGIEI